MQTFNIGINLEVLDQFQYLPRSWATDKYNVNIFDVSKTAIEQGICISSDEQKIDPIDLYFHPASSLLEHPPVLPNIISFKGYTKPEQLSFLHHLKNLDVRRTPEAKRYPNLYVQAFSTITLNSPRQLLKRQYSQFENVLERSLHNELVLKPNFGACGRGVCLIDSHEAKSLTAELLNSEEWFNKHAPDEKAFNYYLQHGGHVSEKITDFTEYRIVKSNRGDLISVLRENNATETSNGLEIGRVGTNHKYDAVLRSVLGKNSQLIDQVRNLLEDLEPMLTTGSFDLWISNDPENPRFGLFEFSTQYALNHCSHDLRIDFLKSIVETYIEMRL